LIDIPADVANSLPAGKLRVRGDGTWSFYQGTSSFTSPEMDNGTLSKATAGGVTTYTYSTPDGQSVTFNGSGYETQWSSADGKETLQYRYSGGDLTGMTAIDGALATFSYSGGLLQTSARSTGMSSPWPTRAPT